MTVSISIEVGPCAPTIPNRATVRIEYGGDKLDDVQRRDIIWTYSGASSPRGGFSLDHYSRETINHEDGSVQDQAVDLIRQHSTDPMVVADAGPMHRQIADHVGSILATVLAVDQPKARR